MHGIHGQSIRYINKRQTMEQTAESKQARRRYNWHGLEVNGTMVVAGPKASSIYPMASVMGKRLGKKFKVEKTGDYEAVITRIA